MNRPVLSFLADCFYINSSGFSDLEASIYINATECEGR